MSTSAPAHSDPDVIVVGAGIAGLTAAFRLQQRGLKVTVLERSHHVGGKMLSVERDGFTINRASTILPNAYDVVRRLAKDVGLTDVMTLYPSAFGIVRDGEVKHLRTAGIGAGIDGVRTDLLSLRSKLKLARLGVDARRTAKKLGHDDFQAAGILDVETVSEYAKRRLNDEIWNYVVAPLMRGIYLDEPDDLSVVDFWLTLGKFSAGGLTRYPKGIDFLAKAVAQRLDVRLDSIVHRVERTPTGARVTWSQAGEEHSADPRASVVAVNGQDVASVYPDIDPRQGELIASVRYGAILKGIFALRELPKGMPTVTMVPPKASLPVGIVIIDSDSMPDAAPAGKALVSAHWVDHYARGTVDLPEEEVRQAMLGHLDALYPGFSRHVEFVQVERWMPATMASYQGLYRDLAELHRLVDPKDPIQLAGDYFNIASTNSSAGSGERAAARVADALASTASRPVAASAL